MTNQEEIFKRKKANETSLIAYGFTKEKDIYTYETKIMNGTFKVVITIHDNIVNSKIYDIDTGDEYINFRINSNTSPFVTKMCEEYQEILEDIASKCFIIVPFLSSQANRLADQIKKKYQDNPEFIFKKDPNYGVFRNPHTHKWYALIMNIDGSKLCNIKKEIEIINVKLDDELIPSLLQEDGFYPAYHMSKKNWISIILNDTLSDDEIMKYIIESHKYTEKK